MLEPRFYFFLVSSTFACEVPVVSVFCAYAKLTVVLWPCYGQWKILQLELEILQA